MAAAPDQAKTGRIVTLDFIRGMAVMGILAMNIVAFAMPEQAYLNPRAFGWKSDADLASWLFSFIFIDGKMRGLFSFLFGASMLLVIERAEAAGLPSERVHFARMAWLLVFGLIHYYLIWWGDILSLYALIGMIAWFFHQRSPEALMRMAVLLVLVQFLASTGLTIQALEARGAAAHAASGSTAWTEYQNLVAYLDVPTPGELAKALALYRGSWLGITLDRLKENPLQPLVELIFAGPETLAYMLAGMALLKTGFLSGEAGAGTYRKVAVRGMMIGVPLYALLAFLLLRDNFDPVSIWAFAIAAPVLLRPAMILAFAALIILLAKGGGALRDRVAAAGRAAFTNYLGTSIVMTMLFDGFGAGWFGSLTRVQLWLVVIPAWAAMLLWSKPWLDKFQYGPLEWLWRSLARGGVQPMLRRGAAARP
jgi:uncharacterized protein